MDPDEAIELCEEILEDCDELPERAQEFQESVQEKVKSVLDFVERTGRCSEKQASMLRNTSAAVKRWLGP